MPEKSKVGSASDIKEQRENQAPGYAAGMFGGAQNLVDTWLGGAVAISQETARFVQTRFTEDMAACSELVACRNPKDFSEWQQRFATKTAEEYVAEFGKLSRMMMDLAMRPYRAERGHTAE